MGTEGPLGVPVRAALERQKQPPAPLKPLSWDQGEGDGALTESHRFPPCSLVAKSHPTSSTFPLAPVSPCTLTVPHLPSVRFLKDT